MPPSQIGTVVILLCQMLSQLFDRRWLFLGSELPIREAPTSFYNFLLFPSDCNRNNSMAVRTTDNVLHQVECGRPTALRIDRESKRASIRICDFQGVWGVFGGCLNCLGVSWGRLGAPEAYFHLPELYFEEP